MTPSDVLYRPGDEHVLAPPELRWSLGVARLELVANLGTPANPMLVCGPCSPRS